MNNQPKFAGKWVATIDPDKRIDPVVPQGPRPRDDDLKPARGKFVTGVATKHDTMRYTGTACLGVATMHKSSAVPVFSNAEAEDVAKMRRN
jgi:hypothetical protein